MFSCGNVSEFAKKTGIKQASLHNYTKGRLPNAESLYNICNIFDVNLNWLIAGKGEMIRGDENDILYNRVGPDEDPEITDLLSRTVEILRSDTDYTSCLAANIRSFHHAMKTENRLNEMESRLVTLETKLKKSEEIRKEDPPGKKEELIKKRAM